MFRQLTRSVVYFYYCVMSITASSATKDSNISRGVGLRAERGRTLPMVLSVSTHCGRARATPEQGIIFPSVRERLREKVVAYPR